VCIHVTPHAKLPSPDLGADDCVGGILYFAPDNQIPLPVLTSNPDTVVW